LLRRRGSRETRTLVTFSDGGFYAIGIKPGDYELAADPGTVARLGLRAATLGFSMPASVEGATVDGLEVVLD
jgi:hypothetical protein